MIVFKVPINIEEPIVIVAGKEPSLLKIKLTVIESDIKQGYLLPKLTKITFVYENQKMLQDLYIPPTTLDQKTPNQANSFDLNSLQENPTQNPAAKMQSIMT